MNRLRLNDDLRWIFGEILSYFLQSIGQGGIVFLVLGGITEMVYERGDDGDREPVGHGMRVEMRGDLRILGG